MFGLPADTVRKKFRTRIVRDNSLNPVYGDEPFVFKKVVLPELASIRIAAYEENGKFLGHRVLPVIGLCPGYRHLTLRNELGQPVPLSTLFLCIVVKDYVPDGLSDFAEALANPIKYQSDLEKRSQQLAVLQEDMEPSEDDGSGNCKQLERRSSKPDFDFFFRPLGAVGTLKKEIKPSDTASSSPKHRQSIVTTTNLINTEASIDQSAPDNNVASGGNPMPVQLPSVEVVKATTVPRIQPDLPSTDSTEIVAETLEKIFEHKSIREKREAMEKKIRALKKSHDKKKVEVMQNEISDGKKSSIFSSNRLVKRLSSKNM